MGSSAIPVDALPMDKRAPAKKLRGRGRECYYAVCGIALLNIIDHSRFQSLTKFFFRADD